MKKTDNTKISKQEKLSKIFEILKNENVSNYEISQNTGISESGLGSITNGETKNPRGLTVNAIYEYLIRKYENTGEMLNETEKSDVKITNDENEAEIFINKNDVKFMIYDDDTIKVEVDMMPFRAYASSDIECYFDKEYRENEFNKSIFTVDKVARGLYLGFKSQNESMNGGGIDDTPSGAELLCRELGRHLWDKLHSTKYGFVLMTKSAIRHKDITNYNKETGMFTLHSRNPEEEDFEENINDIYRIFKVIKRTF